MQTLQNEMSIPSFSPEEEKKEEPVVATPKKKRAPRKAKPVEKEVAEPATPAREDYDPEAPIGDMIEVKGLSLTEKGKAVRKSLAQQELVSTMIPRDPSEPLIAYSQYNICGCKFRIQRGTMVKVPQQIADYIADTYMVDRQIIDNHPNNLKNNEAARLALSS